MICRERRPLTEQATFDHLKQKMLEATALALPNFALPFTVETDCLQTWSRCSPHASRTRVNWIDATVIFGYLRNAIITSNFFEKRHYSSAYLPYMPLCLF